MTDIKLLLVVILREDSGRGDFLCFFLDYDKCYGENKNSGDER